MRSIKNWVFATLLLTFIVVIAGAVVRTTQSGMGCPDWPKCFGKWIPPTNASELPADFEKYLTKQDIDHTFNPYHTWIEYFNRLFGVLLGIFAIIQLSLIYRKRKQLARGALRWARWFLVIVIVTGLFGAVVVKLNLAHFSISVHLFFAILLIQIQLMLWLTLRDKLKSIRVSKQVINSFLTLLIVFVIQTVLGTMVRIHVDDVSALLKYQQREIWLADEPFYFILHRSFSWLVLLLTLFTAWYYRKNVQLFSKMKWVTLTIVLSMVIGIVLYYANMPAFAQPIHLLLATICITQAVAIIVQLKRERG